MDFASEITRLMFGVLVFFFIVLASAAYWAVIGADSILLREDNPRLVEAEARILRGAIYDRRDTLLAETRITESGERQRSYNMPSTYSTLGYFSLRYGTAGVESAFDDILRGDATTTEYQSFIQQEVLHRPQIGTDIRLTLDTQVQQTIVTTMADYRGAAVVVSVPDGAILGILSSPTYDPNTLDADWETLITAEGNPFFNRALQGQYQPGGMLQTPLMVAGILTNQPFDVVTADADRQVQVDDRQIGCAEQPDFPDLTYTEAYAYGCPFPFALLAGQLNAESLSNIFDAFQLNNPPTLADFDATNPAAEATTEPNTVQLSLLEDIVGQGELTINPLGMATIAAAVINDGNAPQPYILDAIRAPDDTWQTQAITPSSIPLMTSGAARRLRELMRNNLTMGASVAAAQPDLMIGGHTALAVSGDATHSWFIGYVSLGDRRGAAIALVLEETTNATEAAAIAGDILAETATALQTPQDEQ